MSEFQQRTGTYPKIGRVHMAVQKIAEEENALINAPPSQPESLLTGRIVLFF